MDNRVGVTSPESTTQTIPSFEEYTPPVTYPEEVEKTLGTSIKVEPLNKTKLKEVGLNCNHNTPFSSREVPSFDGLEPQPLLNSPSLDVILGDVIGPEPPIKPNSLNSSRINVVDYLTTQTPSSPYVANSHPKGVYSYYNPDIYVAGSETRPPMLNKENYVPWPSRLLYYAKSRPNGKLIYNSIINGLYVRRMIPKQGDQNREVLIPETFHEQTDDEFTEAEIIQMEADDQAIQTILLGLPEDIYAAIDSCETA
uniref:Ribonuclease H-like domain-containing protein n=1 Tax=Tanacetum cinerariifolium TaxID=118510 RepID=A0A6L2L425_TANCI|nr:ribonuclease H-like domain-containing protein [Tanacetum cinerariifolium]